MPTYPPRYTPKPFEHVLPIEDRILTIDHDIFLPFCSEASEADTTDSQSAEAGD